MLESKLDIIRSVSKSGVPIRPEYLENFARQASAKGLSKRAILLNFFNVSKGTLIFC